MFHTLLNVFNAGLVIYACHGVGKSVLSLLRVNKQDKLTLSIFSIGIGLYFVTILLVFLSYSYGLNAFIINIFFYGLSCFFLSKSLIGSNFQFNFKNFQINYLSVYLFLICLIYLAVVLTPTLDGDSLSGYLALAREYFLNGAIVPVDYYYGSSFPQNGQLIGTIGFLMGGQITAQLLMIWCMGLLSTITIYSISKSLNLSKNGSLISILIWNTSISILFLYQSSKIDIMWSFFDLLGIYAFSKWFYDYNSQQKSNWLVISGFMFSMSFGIKHVSAFTIFLLLLAIFLVMYKNNNSLKITFKYSFLFLFPISISFFWIFRSYILSGSLFYSGSNLPNETGLLGIFDIIWNMSMLGNASSFEGPMGKSIGPTILAILPTILICKNINSKVLHVLLFSSFMIILWYNGVQRARHLLPTLALLSVTCGYLIDVLPSKYIRYKFFLITMIVTVSLINISQWIHYNFFSIKRVEYIFNNDLDNYLENNLDKFEWYPNFSMTKFINNSLPKDCKIAALSTGNSYYINRKFYSVSKKIGPSFNESIQDIDFIKFYEKLKEFGITHIFLNHFVINQYQLHLCILNSHDFQNKYLKKIMSSGGQIIYEVL